MITPVTTWRQFPDNSARERGAQTGYSSPTAVRTLRSESRSDCREAKATRMGGPSTRNRGNAQRESLGDPDRPF